MPEIKFTLTGDASDLAAGLQEAQKYTSLIAEDFKAISAGMDSVLTRAQKMTNFYQQNVELLEQMKQVLTLIGAMDQAQNAAMNSNLQAARELSSQVLRQGGNFGDVNNMLKYASGGGGYGNMVQDMPAMFQQLANNAAANSSTHAANNIDTSGMNDAINAHRAASSRVPRGHAASAVPGPVTEDAFGSAVANPVATPAPPPSGLFDAYGNPIPSVSIPQQNAKRNLTKKFQNIFNNDELNVNDERYQYAALDAYDSGTRQIDRLLGTRGFGGGLGSLVKKGMYGDRRELRDAIEYMRRQEATDPDIFSRIYSGKDEHGQAFAKDSKEAMLYDTLTRYDKNMGYANSSAGKFMGKAAGHLGMAYNVYGLASQLASAGRVATGYAQNQAQGYGTVQYGTSAGNALEAGWRSGFGLNPFYSYGNAQEAQNAGISMGYRGGALRQYEGIAQNMQTQYGMTQSQTAQAIGTLQQVGMTPAQTAAMLATVRGEAGSVKNGYYNTAAATQTALSAQKAFVAWGGATTTSGKAGAMAGRFSSTPVLQGTGLTGQEGMNSMFGLAMMANAQGISVDKAYAMREQMTRTDAGTSKYIDMYSKNILKQLSNAMGTDLTKIKKREELNQYAVRLYYALQGLQVPVEGPQQAVAYTFNLIEQSKGRYDKNKDENNGTYNGIPGSAAGDASSSRGGRGGSSYGAASSSSKPNVPPPSTAHTGTGTSTAGTSTGSQPDYVTNAYNSYSNSNSGGSDGGSSGGGGNGGVPFYEIGIAKNAQGLLTINKQHQTNSTNGTTAPASMPPRATR